MISYGFIVASPLRSSHYIDRGHTAFYSTVCPWNFFIWLLEFHCTDAANRSDSRSTFPSHNLHRIPLVLCAFRLPSGARFKPFLFYFMTYASQSGCNKSRLLHRKILSPEDRKSSFGRLTVFAPAFKVRISVLTAWRMPFS